MASMAHHHKKGRIESKKEDTTTLFDFDDNSSGAAVGAGGVPAGGGSGGVNDSPEVEPAPPSDSFGFLNIAQLSRNTDSGQSATSNNIYLGGGSHKKYSQEQNANDNAVVAPTLPTTTSSPTAKPAQSILESLVRDGNDIYQKAPPVPKESGSGGGSGGGYISGGAHHQKYSLEQNYQAPTTPSPTSHPTAEPTSAVFSLRDVHSAPSNGRGNSNTNAGVHSKYSKEKNGVNPNLLPEVWESSRPTASPTVSVQAVAAANTMAPTVDIRRVAPSPDEENELNSNEECKSKEGVYGQATKYGGIVLRYQYELTQEMEREVDGTVVGSTKEDGALGLVENVLPVLEERINDVLIPVFFSECSADTAERRGLLEEEAREGAGEHSMLRHKHTNKIVGIEANPADFPLSQSECRYDTIPEAAHCHHIEGALTLHFPPNFAISTLLSSTSLTTLRAIEESMKDGSLKMAHSDIRKLHFLDTSYELSPTVLHSIDGGGVDSLEEPSDGSKLGLILGILIPLLVVCFCCAGIFVWTRMRSKPAEDGDVGSFDEDDILRSRQVSSSSSRFSSSRRRMSSSRHLQSSTNSSRKGLDSDGEYHEEEDDTASSEDYSSSDEERPERHISYNRRTTQVTSNQHHSAASSTPRSDEEEESDGSESSGYSEHSEEEEEKDDEEVDQQQQQVAMTHSSESTDPSEFYRRISQEYGEQQYYNDGSRYYEEGYKSDGHGYSSSASSVNPLDPIFQNQRREKERKRKMKKRQKRIRRRYERMNSMNRSDGSGCSSASGSR